MDAPQLDARVQETDEAGWNVVRHTEPAGLPGSPVFTLKGQGVTEGVEFTRAGGEWTWVVPISVYAPVAVFDGPTEVWRWSAAAGDIVGPPV